MSKHNTKETCPLCTETALQHVHCGHAGCTFRVTTCPKCDREQAVRAFIQDHEGDCVHGPGLQLPLRRVA
jgi:hypothetical protein